MPETIFWWVFTVAGLFAFFFSYGMVEDLIRNWHSNRQTRKEKPSLRVVNSSPDPRGNGHSDSVLH